MRVAIIGSRSISFVDLEKYIPPETTEIVSGGAVGVDCLAGRYAIQKGLPLTEFLPQYDKYGKNAPLIRNLKIINYADTVLAFWDGKSHGTKFVIDKCRLMGKRIKIIYL